MLKELKAAIEEDNFHQEFYPPTSYQVRKLAKLMKDTNTSVDDIRLHFHDDHILYRQTLNGFEFDYHGVQNAIDWLSRYR